MAMRAAMSVTYLTRWVLILLVSVSPVTQASRVTALAPAERAEYQVKALFLYNFANFVQWPDGAFASAAADLRLCLLGDIPFGLFLDDVNGTRVGEHTLRVIQAERLRDIEGGCQIVFVGADQRQLLPGLLNSRKYTYVLSVGESQDFVKQGGIIEIVRTSDRLRFDIDLSNALKNGLNISSDLLALARQVHRITESRSPTACCE